MSTITRAITTDGSARIFYCDSTDIVKEAHRIHDTSKTITATLGRALTATALMGSLLKDRDNSLTLKIKGDGPVGTIVCVSDYMGNVRGFAENPGVELPPKPNGKLDVGGAVGRGELHVIKDMGLNEPYMGMCDLVSGEIAEDITRYFALSEQTPSVCALGVRCSKDNDCTAAGGFLLQLMPGAEDSLIDKLEQNVSKITSISDIASEPNAAAIVFGLVFDGIEYEIFDCFDNDYKCNCSREKYFNALTTLGEEELSDLCLSPENIETVCHFCRRKYVFDDDDKRRLLNEAKIRKQ